jgi:hypothetical protein
MDWVLGGSGDVKGLEEGMMSDEPRSIVVSSSEIME